MQPFVVGQKVSLVTYFGITFEIVKINLDQSFEIKMLSSGTEAMSLNNISSEMLQRIEGEHVH